MDQAFQAFQADLAGVGSTGQMAPPPQFVTGQTMYLPPPGQTLYPPGPPPFYGGSIPPPPMPGGGAYRTAASSSMSAPGPSSLHQQSAQPSGQGIAQARGTNMQPPKAKQGQAPPAQGDKKKGPVREAAGKRWRDPSLDEWPDNDFRIFVGNLGNEVNDDALGKAFQKYPSFAKAKIVKDKRTKKTKGFGFVSFLTSEDFGKALKEMQGKYVGNRPIKLRKSTTEERNMHLPAKKAKQQQQPGKQPGSSAK
ncbi:hypothetical protein QJQ45_007262 [Haematococcus lacustris]|nr:hypothetical protein QJQ45_007262 [Haematococcus lacustris]